MSAADLRLFFEKAKTISSYPKGQSVQPIAFFQLKSTKEGV
jgi:hypothetical protein